MFFSLRIKEKHNLKVMLKSVGMPVMLAAIFVLGFVLQSTSSRPALAAANPLPTPPQTVVEGLLKKGNEKKSTTKETSKKKPQPKPVKTVPVKQTNPPRPIRQPKPRPRQKPLPKVEERQQVTFMTGATGVEILLNGKSHGLSDKNGKLSAWVVNGEHNIVAAKYNQNLFDASNITVNAEQKTFDFSAQVAKGLDNIRQNLPSPNDEPSTEAKTIDVTAVLDAYRDPNKTDTVTVKDWQTIYEQSQKQLMFGSTDNGIEGLNTFAQGQVELSLGNKVKALNLFEAAANIYVPNSAMMHYGLGVVRLSNGNLNDAGSSFIKTLQLDPKYALAYKGLGDVYLAQNKTREAATQYQQAQRLGMTAPGLRLNIAEVQIKNKNCAAAMKELEVLRTEAPSAGVMMALSDCYLEQKRAVSAIEALKEALSLEPNSPVIHYKLGAIYYKQKEYGNAKESLEKALILDTDNKLDQKELKEMITKAQKNAR